MKKILLGTTAIVAAGIIAAPSADAAEKVKLKVGGFMEQTLGFTTAEDEDSSTDFEGFGIDSNTEVQFKGSTTLDNGIKVGVVVELEGNTTGDQIDESYLTATGNFGQVIFGSENSAMYKMQYTSTDFGHGINSGDQTTWVPNTIGASGGFFRSPFGTTYVEPVSSSNDAEALSYYTPRIEGFRLGLSYIPEAGQDDGGAFDRNDEVADGFSVGANFDRKLGGVQVQLAVGYGAFTDGPSDQEDPSAFSLGGKVGFGGFTVGASYAANEGTVNGDEEEGFDVGVSWKQGPLGVSLNYFRGESDAINTNGVITNDGEHDSVSLGARYTLGPGIVALTTLGYTEYSTDNTASADNNEADGTYLLAGLRISF